MAEVKRRVTLVNPARRRKRNPKRKMSAKQIAHFGTKRQKAALKASRKRKRTAKAPSRKNPIRRRRTVAAPRKTRRPAHRRRTRRSNPGGIVEVALLNPAPKRRNTVARRKRRSTSRRRHVTRRRQVHTNPVARRARRRRNPVARRGRRRSIRRSNPSVGGVTSLVTSAMYAIGGAVGSKLLTQAALGSKNTGYMGYAANLAASFIVGKGVGMVVKNKQAQNAVILGGVIQVVLRFLVDQTPLGARVQNAFGMGDYQATTFLSPARYTDAARSANVDIPAALRPTALPAAGMAGLAGGTYSRSRSTY